MSLFETRMLTERLLNEVSNFVNAHNLPSSTGETNDAQVINYFSNDVAAIKFLQPCIFLESDAFLFQWNTFYIVCQFCIARDDEEGS